MMEFLIVRSAEQTKMIFQHISYSENHNLIMANLVEEVCFVDARDALGDLLHEVGDVLLVGAELLVPLAGEHSRPPHVCQHLQEGLEPLPLTYVSQEVKDL